MSTGILRVGRQSLRQHPSSIRRRLNVRTLSYTSIPRFVARALRVPIAGFAIGAGGLWYANYKLEELRNRMTRWLSSVQDAATDLIDSASDGIKSVSARASDVKLPQFLKDLFASDYSTLDKKTDGWLSSVQGGATDLMSSASDGIRSGASAVKPPNVETPWFLKDRFASDGSTLNKKTNGWLSSVQDATTGLIGSAPGGIESSVSAVKLPNVKTPQFFKDLFASDDSARHDHRSSRDSGDSRKKSPE